MLGTVKHYSPPRGSMINALSWRRRTGYASPDRVKAHAHAVVVREIYDIILAIDHLESCVADEKCLSFAPN